MSSKSVNNLLHTLRGEQFRHAQNIRRSRTHISTSVLSRNGPTLPVHLPHSQTPSLIQESSAYANCPGPEAPRSWVLTCATAYAKVIHETPAWRSQALSIALPPPAPSLVTLCLHILAAYPSDLFVSDIAPYLPSHLRRNLIRDAAIHSPLPSSKLYALFEADGHAGGEILVVGPVAELRDDFFLRVVKPPDDRKEVDDSWDDDNNAPEILTTLVLVSTRLAMSSLLSLPPTITKIAFVNLLLPISVHRLPATCPLLVMLDLSYNTWLAHENDANKNLGNVEWSRWSYLQILGLRGCHFPEDLRRKLNGDRWNDVEVILQ